jgi:predicted RNase H-like nuclease (RuvC/YqgF family)
VLLKNKQSLLWSSLPWKLKIILQLSKLELIHQLSEGHPRRKLVLAEDSLPSTDVVKPRARLSRFKVSPLEKEALEAIVQLSESPPESAPETEQGPKDNWAKLFKDADRQLKEVQEKNQRLHQENVTLGRQLSSQIDELAGECNQLKRNIRKKMIQRKQLVNVYKQNLSLREENRKLAEDLYLAKNMLSKKNLAIFLKEITSSSSPKHGD